MLRKLLGLFRKSPAEDPLPEHFVIAHISARLEPMDRGDVFEDPLDEKVRALGIGQVTGGGTQMEETGEIAFVDVEVSVDEITETVIGQIASALEALGAPKGSEILGEDGETLLSFGRTEGLGLYLNATDLDDAVYEATSLDEVVNGCGAALGETGRVFGARGMETETAVYMYGPSFAAMQAAIAPFVAEYPLCERARIDQVA